MKESQTAGCAALDGLLCEGPLCERLEVRQRDLTADQGNLRVRLHHIRHEACKCDGY